MSCELYGRSEVWGEIEDEIKDKVKIEKDYMISLSKRKDLEEE